MRLRRGEPYRRRIVPIEPARRRRGIRTAAYAFGVFAAVFAMGMVITNLPLNAGGDEPLNGGDFRASMDICGMVRHTCVVDGDTIWFGGTKIRIADIDTPEISSPKCDYEYDLGIKARDRLRELLDNRAFSLRTIGGRDEDRYGRKLRVVVQHGRSVGDVLVEEGLARTWTGRRQPWC